MAWDDVVFGVLTGGAYNVGKAAFKASEAAGEVGDAVEDVAEEAGEALAALTQTIAQLGKDTSSFITEIEDLLTTKRLTPRDEDDLWDEEVERLEKLRAMEAALVAELTALGSSDDQPFSFGFGGFGLLGHLADPAYRERLQIEMKLSVVRAAIDEILLQEPGVVTQSLQSVRDILERFNQFSQPRLDDILDSVDDNLETTNEIQEEVKKLFVRRRRELIPVAQIKPEIQKKITGIEHRIARIDRLVEKDVRVADQLQEHVLRVQPGTFSMARKQVRGDGSLAPVEPPGTARGGTRPTDIKHGSILGIDPNVPFPGLPQKDRGKTGGTTTTGKPVPGSSAGTGVVRAPRVNEAAVLALNLSSRRKVAPFMMQTRTASVGTLLKRNEVNGFYSNYLAVQGRTKALKRERLKLERTLIPMRFRIVEEPGVIPRILEEFRGVLEQFRTQEQPRLDTILDSTNAAVAGLTTTMASADAVLVSVNELLGGINENKGKIKLGGYIVGGLFLLILVLGTIALARAAFGF